ncbi:hypothetical protein P8452_65746 [Trifolium repens]|nr:hypothetical protein P8452_65746 [Trifolium repens]
MSMELLSSFVAVADGQQSKNILRKPKYSRFTQQELPARQPILTPGWVISIFTCIGLIFISIGVASVVKLDLKLSK